MSHSARNLVAAALSTTAAADEADEGALVGTAEQRRASAEHQQSLESFYALQATHYDESRMRMLHGRLPMMHALRFPAARGVWVDLGAGTGHNLDEMLPYLDAFRAIVLVDLSPSLLAEGACVDRMLHCVMGCVPSLTCTHRCNSA